MDFWSQYFASKKTRDAVIGTGVVATAVVGSVVGILLLDRWAFDGTQTQTGYRGTGMVNFVEEADAARLAALNTLPESDPPLIPEEGEPLAGEVYENVQVLGHLTEGNFLRLMNALTQWVAPEQSCNYCHAGADDGNYADDGLYTKHVARRMIQMTQHINETWTDHVKQTGVTCYTCHRGQPVPQYVWYEEPRPKGPGLLGDNTMRQNRADATVGYTSLPGDPLTAFLLKDTPIRVVPTVERETPFNASIQDAEWTYGLMFHLSESLGVNCTFCHNSRSFVSWGESPPQRVNAWYGIRMVRDLNQNYLHNLTVYPPNRLGPMGDAPKASCITCHQGVNKPLYGASMIGDWPELSTTGTPVYPAPEGGSATAPSTADRADAGTVSAN